MLPSEAKLPDILQEITKKNIGAVAIIDTKMNLTGVITDYDIRKLMTENRFSNDTSAADIMNKNPIKFTEESKAYDILLKMENRERPISVAPIVDKNNMLKGMVSLHDLLQKGLK